ncbi:MAG: aryl-sulfate sulfotransferase [Flavobacteriales bacterium]|nr:aryl-sulfate sulfotransferase [Flavobacteriales bacterium]
MTKHFLFILICALLLSQGSYAQKTEVCKKEQACSAPSKSLEVPDEFPQIFVDLYGETGEGDIFLTTAGSMNGYNRVIIDNYGDILFYEEGRAYDFKMINDNQLVYCDFSSTPRKFYVTDSLYAKVDSFECGNGYKTDWHDIEILPNGNALMLCEDKRLIEMSDWGGDSNAVVSGGIIQEIDATTKDVLFEWSSFDHFDYEDGLHDVDVTREFFSYVHINSIQLDDDGNIIISCRNMDEATKIDRSTGDIIWRLGGKNNQFEFTNDTGMFCSQHHVRRIENGNITLYDNSRYEERHSRAVEYELDEVEMTATMVWEQYHDKIDKAIVMGSIQRLENGNSLIDWGSTAVQEANITEYDADGTKVLEIFIDSIMYVKTSYRAYRFKWRHVTCFLNSISSDAYLFSNYPNPFINSTTLMLNIEKQEHAKIEIINMAGRTEMVILDGAIKSGIQKLNINTQSLAPGTYLCIARFKNHTYSKKLIKQ